jgi:hypothetical protein
MEKFIKPMSKQLNISYEAERDYLYKGIKEREIKRQEEFERSKNGKDYFSINGCLEWLKQGNKIEDYKPVLKL